MKVLRRHSALLIPSLILVAVVGLFVLPGLKQRGRQGYTAYLPAPMTARAAEVNPWTLAVQKIKEDRGEATGKQAKVDIPHQVRHYSDTRRFLAIQVAEVRERSLKTPQDLIDLGAMIARGELAALRPATENYILFGVGGNATKDAFTRYENGKSVTLYNEAELQQRYSQMAESRTNLEKQIAGLKQELSGVKKKERSRRARLQAQMVSTEKTLKAERETKGILDRHYGNGDARQQLFADYESLKALAASHAIGQHRAFDIENPRDRQQMKVQMLSSLRPEALRVLEEVALSYRQTFNRPLPITSLVRPDEYQHALSKVNPNATRIETPPHSTGLAFDILYRYLTAAEQAHVMAHLARLKDEGRIEVLRENRDHYHVFAFVDGSRPNETMISASLGESRKASLARQSHHSQRSSNKAKKKPAAAKKRRAKRR